MKIAQCKSCLLFVSVILMAISCRYEEGPGISLRTVQNRLQGTWHVDKFFINTIDSTDYYYREFNCYLYFTDDDHCRFTGPCQNGFKYTFMYRLEKNCSIIIFEINVPPYPIVFEPFTKFTKTEWNICKLSNLNLNIECVHEGNEYRMEMQRLY